MVSLTILCGGALAHGGPLRCCVEDKATGAGNIPEGVWGDGDDITPHQVELGLKHGLEVESDLDLLADENTTGFQCCIPGQTKVFTVDLGFC